MESKEKTASPTHFEQEITTSTSSSWINMNVIHIIVEAVALCGIMVYFSNRINKLEKHIEEMAARLEDQEEALNRHEEILKKLVEQTRTNNNNVYHAPAKVSFSQPPVQSKMPEKVVEKMPEKKEVADEKDLDSELQEELSDLKKKE